MHAGLVAAAPRAAGEGGADDVETKAARPDFGEVARVDPTRIEVIALVFEIDPQSALLERGKPQENRAVGATFVAMAQ